MSIQVEGVCKNFGAFRALDQVSLVAPTGSLMALLGPSGCGKTTLLRIIAGLETPDQGLVRYQDEEVTGTPVQKRNVGFVFQHYALFRHLPVFENIAFGLRVKKWPEEKIRQRVGELLHLVRMDGLGNRYPSQLSGGQRQRVALARALASEPRVLLLDEPFGALDAKVRKELRRWLRRLHDELHVTSIFVTHDQEEALEVADRVVLMNKGKVEQVGSPQAVWDHPASPFVVGFLGDVNLFHGRTQGGEMQIGADHQAVRLLTPEHSHVQDAKALAYVRPHDLDVQRYLPGHQGGIVARLARSISVGPIARLELEPSEDSGLDPATVIEAQMVARSFADQQFKEGELLVVTPRQARVFVEA